MTLRSKITLNFSRLPRRKKKEFAILGKEFTETQADYDNASKRAIKHWDIKETA